MSYSRQIPCGDCAKRDACIDGKVIDKAIDLIHDCSATGAHQGYGEIVMDCQAHVASNPTPA